MRGRKTIQIRFLDLFKIHPVQETPATHFPDLNIEVWTEPNQSSLSLSHLYSFPTDATAEKRKQLYIVQQQKKVRYVIEIQMVFQLTILFIHVF